MTKPMVWVQCTFLSFDISNTPDTDPSGMKIGAAAQLKKLFTSKKCSVPFTNTAEASASAVPIALVPRSHSNHDAPVFNRTRSALSTKSGSPIDLIMVPL